MPAMMDERAPISVVVPTLNAAEGLPMTLAALAPAALGGLVREVVISDGGSTDDVAEIADAAGARFIVGRRGRGVQLAQGAAEARGRWLLFLHADTQLEPGWENDASALIESGEDNVGVFSLRFDEAGVAPALVAGGAMIAGIPGALFAVPLAAFVNVVAVYLSTRHTRGTPPGPGDFNDRDLIWSTVPRSRRTPA